MSDLIKQIIAAGEVVRWRRAAGLMLINEASAPVDVQVMRAGAEVFSALAIGRGVKVRPAGGFDELVFKNPAGASVALEVFITSGDVDVQISTGISVTVDNDVANPVPVDIQGATITAGEVSLTGATHRGAFTNTQKTVTNADGQLLAANAARRYLLIQNKDASAQVWVKFGAGAATTANGVLIAPGGSYELQGYVSSDEVRAIGDVASNANVVTVEG